MKLGSLQPRPLTGLECRVIHSIHSVTLQLLKFLLGRANWFGGQIVLGGILFRGSFVLGGFLTGSLWLEGFCLGNFMSGAFDRIPWKTCVYYIWD